MKPLSLALTSPNIISLPLIDAGVWYIPTLFSQALAADYFQQLSSMNHIQWQQTQIKLFGRECYQPRLTAWYGDEQAEYSYSGLQLKPLTWCPVLLDIKRVVEHAIDTSFNSVLLNYYRDGADSMGWHSDDEPELGPRPLIASVSFGAERDFVMRHKHYKSNGLKPVVMTLAAGSCLVMAGTTQQYWQHQVPKRSIKKIPDGRINLTFRSIITP
ncbi:alpha-ketoglutarate-dependent dioxygenase AlkB [Endozoicomonas sp. SM1973]|uniref:Alpha-ketoglutarate-dependent dioxygenase AlkB n=1 Tax=Spartinivicinus marinus TaxID=2994442 RepID=A0A853IAQ8_9GAMM|nr:alpha-ketoglutarate-dependent dioxygenase AlkB [Spartinivicinus marinus]MCX4029108.1 alpha-ketoglutarate-dependent dioxygenase AlkB [Spartinivicinus marinus]NYZ67728.1 alpha-ketoglutarate-dependent dioxygenase AlkB [Spartinivicinus marinus]